MLVLMKTEFWKLKRYHMVWAGVFLMRHQPAQKLRQGTEATFGGQA